MARLRVFLLSICVFASLGAISVAAQTTPQSRLNIFKDAVDAIAAAGDAIAKVTDGIAHLIKSGAAGWNYLSAQSTHNRLIDISARATNLAGAKQMPLINSIDEYIEKDTPTTADWNTVRSAIGGVVSEVKVLLDAIKSERSDFIREDAYSALVQTLAARSNLLDKLQSLPQPATPEEKNALRDVNIQYKRLLANFEAAIKELNAYLKQAKPA
jgi:hypothetical protein